jgi:hypothetical protein
LFLKGRSFTLKNSTVNTVGAPVSHGGRAGQYTKEEGIYSYYEVCDKLNVDGWKRTWDERQQSLYATHNDQWVGFDNQRSIALKVKWAYTMGLGGSMMWTLDFDDYTGKFCNEGPFPLANAIKSIFDEYAPPSTTVVVPSTASTTTPPVTVEVKMMKKLMATSASNTTAIARGNTTASKYGYISIKGNNITFIRNSNGNLMRNYNSSMAAAAVAGVANNMSASSHIFFQNNRRSSGAASSVTLLFRVEIVLAICFSPFVFY